MENFSTIEEDEKQDPENGKYVWDETVLTDMLINPVYYGAVSSQKKNYKFKVGVINEKKPDEWIIVENYKTSTYRVADSRLPGTQKN